MRPTQCDGKLILALANALDDDEIPKKDDKGTDKSSLKDTFDYKNDYVCRGKVIILYLLLYIKI